MPNDGTEEDGVHNGQERNGGERGKKKRWLLAALKKRGGSKTSGTGTAASCKSPASFYFLQCRIFARGGVNKRREYGLPPLSSLSLLFSLVAEGEGGEQSCANIPLPSSPYQKQHGGEWDGVCLEDRRKRYIGKKSRWR